MLFPWNQYLMDHIKIKLMKSKHLTMKHTPMLYQSWTARKCMRNLKCRGYILQRESLLLDIVIPTSIGNTQDTRDLICKQKNRNTSN